MKSWITHYASVFIGLVASRPLNDAVVPDDWHWLWRGALSIVITLIVILLTEVVLTRVLRRTPRLR